MRTGVIVLCSVVGTLLLTFGGCYTMLEVIKRSNGCESFNIDNVEVGTGINIPDTKDCKCKYDKDKHVKSNLFELDLEAGREMGEYINEMNFIKAIECAGMPSFQYSSEWNEQISKRTRESIYFKYGARDGHRYLVVLDSAGGRLYVEKVRI